ncbi:MAG TPA: hypothetical protein VKS78_09405 [Roseiarcus sp.]|nr:hypothetical protein [Roseiarcus sp.]
MRALLDRLELEHAGVLPDRPSTTHTAAAAPRSDDGRLAALAGGDLAERFRQWRGASGRRYIFSVYDRNACPTYDHAVLIAATVAATGERRIAFIADTGSLPDLVFGEAMEGGGIFDPSVEFHVHLLAASRAERVALIGDLRANLDYMRRS